MILLQLAVLPTVAKTVLYLPLARPAFLKIQVHLRLIKLVESKDCNIHQSHEEAGLSF